MDRLEVVVARDQRVGHRRPCDARAGRHTQRERPRSGLYEKRIRVAVVAAFELDNPLPAGCGTRDADGAHGGLGARAHEADALERRHQPSDAFAELDFERARRAVARAVLDGISERVHQAARRMAVDQRAPRHHVVDELVAVDVHEAGAVRPLDEERRGADGFERAYRAVHAAREDQLRAGK
jgi:hypothetical protein